MPAWVAMTISRSAWSPPASAVFMSPLSSEANGSLVFHSGCCGASAFTPVEREIQLHRHRLLAQERAVVVEGVDSLGDRDKRWRAFLRHFLHEGDDALLCGPVVPGWKRVGGKGRVYE